MCDASGATHEADIIGTSTPENVEWPYLKKFVKPKRKSGKNSIIRRATAKAVKEDKEIDEVIDMNNQRLPENWVAAKRLWNKLIEMKAVYPTDHEGLITFERFYSTYIQQHKKEPSIEEVMKKFIEAR